MITDDEKLSSAARKCILDKKSKLYLSSASVWEIVIKTSIGKLTLPDQPQTFISKQLSENLIDELPVTFKHAFHLLQLPYHHKDPFDRMLISQAQTEKLSILTTDSVFTDYDVKTIW
jgi:PIN domain nuclease of toxin-antitoxin system